ncbi:MAG TPA: NAD(P)/FAD-dependent oxidoreductase [Pyrinomonadaceae bacterium]|jgi:flavin-dependent dehydrogenase
MNKKRQTILNSSLIPHPSSLHYDVVVAGGGPAGTSAAIHLAGAGARVLLAEQKKFPRAKLCGEFISPECLEHFGRLGVGDAMMGANGARLVETVFYARGGSSVSVPSEWFGTRGSAAVAALGLSRAEMDERLLERARRVGVDVLEEAQVIGLVVERGRVCGVDLRTGDGSTHSYSSLLTIDATGRARSLARRVETHGTTSAHNRKSRRAPLVAFKAHLEGARGREDHCEIYLYRGGYGGLSRIEGGLSNLCFIAEGRDVRACGSDAERVMREVLASNRRARYTLASARVCSEWLSVALDGFGARELVPADGLVAVGDAASFIDPFTGSGMLMALESGEIAALSIARWLPQLSDKRSFQRLADDYRSRYHERFKVRLRVSSALRRAAFVPRLAEMTMLAVGASERLRRTLARATRPRAQDTASRARHDMSSQ